MGFTVLKEAKVRVVIGVTLEPATVPHINFPFALILPPIPVAHHTFSLAFAILHLAHI
jgi:hypothetical protein